jgi:hypothetical protein
VAGSDNSEGHIVSGVVHLAGLVIQVDNHMRQRCSWCGAVLCDYALDRVMVPSVLLGPPATWEVDASVLVDGMVSVVIEREGTKLPEGSCALLDPEVTQ